MLDVFIRAALFLLQNQVTNTSGTSSNRVRCDQTLPLVTTKSHFALTSLLTSNEVHQRTQTCTLYNIKSPNNARHGPIQLKPNGALSVGKDLQLTDPPHAPSGALLPLEPYHPISSFRKYSKVGNGSPFVNRSPSCSLVSILHNLMPLCLICSLNQIVFTA